MTGRASQPARPGAEPGGIQQRVLCAADVGALYEFARTAFPDFAVIGVVSLTSLEETARQVRDALAGTPHALPVYIDPTMAR